MLYKLLVAAFYLGTATLDWFGRLLGRLTR
jgi:hypothetical protein